MAAMRFGDSGDDPAQGRLRKPFGYAATQDTIAQSAFAGDHQDGAAVLREGVQQKRGQDGASAILSQAMQVDGRGQAITSALQATAAPGLDRLRRRLAGSR
jgi:hypothetical protein